MKCCGINNTYIIIIIHVLIISSIIIMSVYLFDINYLALIFLKFEGTGL